MIDGFDHSRLVNFAATLVGRQDADDVVQEVYVKWLSGEIPPCRGEATRDTWLLSVVKHTAYRWRQKNPPASSPPTVHFNSIYQEGVRLAYEREASYTPDYVSAIDAKAALATLSVTHQTVLRVFSEHGGYASVAAALGLTRDQVRGRLYRARRKLRASR